MSVLQGLSETDPAASNFLLRGRQFGPLMMKQKIIKGRLPALVVIFAFVVLGLTVRFPAGAQSESNGRERVFASPSPTMQPSPGAASLQTLSDLQARVRNVLNRPELARGRIGVKIVSLDSGKVLFEDSAEKFFMPASNMKSYTVAAAMDKLTPDFRFITSVYSAQAADTNGTIRGPLTIYGRGDPSISTAFNDGDYFKGMQALADKIVAAGVKRIEGDLIGDESYYNSDPIPPTWQWDDLQWYYGAEVSALTVNDNAFDLTVRPGASVGAPAVVLLSPNASGLNIINSVTTQAAGTRRYVGVYRKLGSSDLEITGTVPIGMEKFAVAVAAPRPASVFISMLRRALEQKNVVITGRNRVVSARDKALGRFPSQLPPVEITRLESPPFSAIAAATLKPSQNLYAELILRALGESAGDKSDSRKTSEARGIEVVQKFLAQAGVASGSVLQYDGCGLSRHDLVTPASTAQLYVFMSRRPYAQIWRDAQTIAGVDGTLKSRFTGTAAAGNMRGKTGTFDQVSSLSGYLTSASGEKLAVSLITNNIQENRVRTAAIDEIIEMLAAFPGRSN
jgi:serine-type D-Ala-D-Ala carboxypeptidase/endopeptidase (penicillin-binding protein 4)